MRAQVISLDHSERRRHGRMSLVRTIIWDARRFHGGLTGLFAARDRNRDRVVLRSRSFSKKKKRRRTLEVRSFMIKSRAHEADPQFFSFFGWSPMVLVKPKMNSTFLAPSRELPLEGLGNWRIPDLIDLLITKSSGLTYVIEFYSWRSAHLLKNCGGISFLVVAKNLEAFWYVGETTTGVCYICAYIWTFNVCVCIYVCTFQDPRILQL